MNRWLAIALLLAGCTEASAGGFTGDNIHRPRGFIGAQSGGGSPGSGGGFFPSTGAPAGGPTDPPTTGLVAHWRTDTGLFADTGCATAITGASDDQQSVECWRDKISSYDLTFTGAHASGAIAPKYLHNFLSGGVHGLYCNKRGMLEGTTVTALPDSSTEFALYVVYESAANDVKDPTTDDVPDDDQVFIYYDDGVDTDYIWMWGGRRATPNTSKPRALVNGNGAGEISNLPTTDTNGGSIHVVLLNVDFSLASNEQTLIVDFSETDQVSNAATDIGTGYDTLSLCNRLGGDFGAFQGVLLEVGLYSAFMSSGDQTTLQNYINTRYGTSF